MKVIVSSAPEALADLLGGLRSPFMDRGASTPDVWAKKPVRAAHVCELPLPTESIVFVLGPNGEALIPHRCGPQFEHRGTHAQLAKC